MVKQYYYKFGDLPVQNIGTGNPELQQEIEDLLVLNTIETSEIMNKTVSILSSDIDLDSVEQ